MRRLATAAALGLLLSIPSSSALAQQTASRTFTVTVSASPLITAIPSGCSFVVAENETGAVCVTTIRVAQPTLETDGWSMALGIAELRDTETGVALPADAVHIVSVDLAVDGGQSIDAGGGPFMPASSAGATLERSRAVIVANPGYGNGAYTAVVRLRLSLPNGAPAGRYTPTWAIDIANGVL